MEDQQNFTDVYKIINDPTLKLSIATINAKLNSKINIQFINNNNHKNYNISFNNSRKNKEQTTEENKQKSKINFYNALTIILNDGFSNNISCKIFSNGSLQITGIKHINTIYTICPLIYNILLNDFKESILQPEDFKIYNKDDKFKEHEKLNNICKHNNISNFI